jgi:type I restriction enzyme S subunit
MRESAEPCPTAWEAVHLGEVLDLLRNGTTATQVPDPTPYAVSRIETIADGTIDWSRVGFLRMPDERYRLRPGDLLYSHINSVAHMGKVALYQGGRALYHGMNLMLLRPAATRVQPEFLHAVLASQRGRKHARRECKSAINQASLSQGDITRFALCLPPLPEQRQIAAILDTLDDAIRKTEQIIAKLKQVKQGLLHDLLTRGIDDNGELRDPERHPEQFKDSPLGRIPRGWRASNLGSEFTLQRGFDITVAEQRPGPYPVVSSSGITSFHSRAMVHGPGVVTGRKGKLGDAYYIEGPHWPHDTSLWVKDFHGNDQRFAALFLKALRLERFDAATSVPTLNRNFVHPLAVVVPMVPEQRRIVSLVTAAENRVTGEAAQLRKLGVLKAGLMEDLLTGRVRVTSLLEATTP